MQLNPHNLTTIEQIQNAVDAINLEYSNFKVEYDSNLERAPFTVNYNLGYISSVLIMHAEDAYVIAPLSFERTITALRALQLGKKFIQAGNLVTAINILYTAHLSIKLNQKYQST